MNCEVHGLYIYIIYISYINCRNMHGLSDIKLKKMESAPSTHIYINGLSFLTYKSLCN